MTIKATVAKLKEFVTQSNYFGRREGLVKAADVSALIAHTESQDARIEALEAECARVKALVPKSDLHDWLLQDTHAGFDANYQCGRCLITFYEPMEGPYKPKDGCSGIATPATAPLMGEGEKCKCENQECRMKGSRICSGEFIAQPYGGTGCNTFLGKNDQGHNEWCGHDKACHQGALHDQ